MQILGFTHHSHSTSTDLLLKIAKPHLTRKRSLQFLCYANYIRVTIKLSLAKYGLWLVYSNFKSLYTPLLFLSSFFIYVLPMFSYLIYTPSQTFSLTPFSIHILLSCHSVAEGSKVHWIKPNLFYSASI